MKQHRSTSGRQIERDSYLPVDYHSLSSFAMQYLRQCYGCPISFQIFPWRKTAHCALFFTENTFLSIYCQNFLVACVFVSLQSRELLHVAKDPVSQTMKTEEEFTLMHQGIKNRHAGMLQMQTHTHAHIYYADRLTAGLRQNNQTWFQMLHSGRVVGVIKGPG